MNKFPIVPLFIPANHVEWAEKEASLYADAYIFDLEDSVTKKEKKKSRKSLKEYLNSSKLRKPCIIRINSVQSEEIEEDLAELTSLPEEVIALMIPKVESSQDLEMLPDSVQLILLIETPLALKNLHLLVLDSRVKALAFGAADLSNRLGSDMSWNSLIYSRAKIILEASENNLFTIDSPFMLLNSEEELEKECRLSKSMGFTSKAAIHPDQISIIKDCFLPTPDEIREAEEAVRAFSKSGGGVISLSGKMLDEPIINLMEKRLLLMGLDPENYK